MEESTKSLLQVSRESLISELSMLPHLETKSKESSKKSKGKTLPPLETKTKSKGGNTIISPKVKQKIKDAGKEALSAAGRSARDALISRAGEIGGDVVRKILGKGKST